MRLSIVTVCYNEKDIGRTCESIVSQSCQDFEWIVVDGGSTDGSLEVTAAIRLPITVLSEIFCVLPEITRQQMSSMVISTGCFQTGVSENQNFPMS